MVFRLALVALIFGREARAAQECLLEFPHTQKVIKSNEIISAEGETCSQAVAQAITQCSSSHPNGDCIPWAACETPKNGKATGSKYIGKASLIDYEDQPLGKDAIRRETCSRIERCRETFRRNGQLTEATAQKFEIVALSNACKSQARH